MSYIYQMLKLSDGDLYNKDKRNKLMGPVKKKINSVHEQMMKTTKNLNVKWTLKKINKIAMIKNPFSGLSSLNGAEGENQ